MGWFLCSGKSKKKVKNEQDKKSDDQIPSGIDACRKGYLKDILVGFCAFGLPEFYFFSTPLFISFYLFLERKIIFRMWGSHFSAFSCEENVPGSTVCE